MSGPNENGGDGFCDLGEAVGDDVGEVLGFVPELGDEDANATELQQHPRCTLARAVFGAFLTSGAVVSRHAYRCPFCWVWYGCRPRAEAYPPTEDRACGACSGVFEAGRLAAIRAEVERAMPGMAAHASRLLRDGLVDLQEARREKPGGYRFLLIQDAEGKVATAWLFAAEVADCRRWLEATS